MAALGDLVFRDSAVWKWLRGNTSATRKFLSETGDGTDSAAPVWDTLTSSDLPDTAVTPGSYTRANLTVDVKGRVTAATNGSGNPTVVAGEAFTGDGSTTAFVLAHTPTAGSVAVYVNGVRVTTWSLSTATVTFTAAPALGDEILVDYVY